MANPKPTKTTAPRKSVNRTPVKKMRPQMVPRSKTTSDGKPRPKRRV